MNGKEALKHYRTEKGYSVRRFAALLQVTPKTVYAYESQEVPLASMPTGRAVRTFSLLEVDLEDFFDSFYPYKEELANAIRLWQSKNPIELDFNVLKTRLNNRIMKAKERNVLSEKAFLKINNQFVKTFTVLEKKKDSTGNILESDYMKYVFPVCQLMRKATYQIQDNYLREGFLNSQYNLSEIADFCGISKRHFISVVNGEREISTLRIITVLKLCYVLKLDFKKFTQGIGVEENNQRK